MSDTQKTLSALPEEDKNDLLEQDAEVSAAPAEARNNGPVDSGEGQGNEGGASGEGPAGEGDDAAPVIPSVLPVLPLRDSVVFNSMIVPLFESREKAMETVEFALKDRKSVV